MFVDRGVYDVYRHFASGEPVFADPEKVRDSVELLRLIIALGRESWSQRTKDLALILHKSPDTVTYIQREGVRQRLEDEPFS